MCIGVWILRSSWTEILGSLNRICMNRRHLNPECDMVCFFLNSQPCVLHDLWSKRCQMFWTCLASEVWWDIGEIFEIFHSIILVWIGSMSVT